MSTYGRRPPPTMLRKLGLHDLKLIDLSTKGLIRPMCSKIISCHMEPELLILPYFREKIRHPGWNISAGLLPN